MILYIVCPEGREGTGTSRGTGRPHSILKFNINLAINLVCRRAWPRPGGPYSILTLVILIVRQEGRAAWEAGQYCEIGISH